MSFGAGIVWSTILVLIALAIWQVSKKKKWKIVGKVFGVLLLLGALVSAGMWAWSKYKDRPQVVTELAGLSVGMSEVDVTLKLGKPTDRMIGLEDGKWGPMRLAYVDEYDDDNITLIIFDIDTVRVNRICKFGSYDKVLGLSTLSGENDVVEKLGPPDKVSVYKDGLKKLISYSRWKVAYEIQKGKVKGACTFKDEAMEYKEEFEETPAGPLDPFDAPAPKPREGDPIVDSENGKPN